MNIAEANNRYEHIKSLTWDDESAHSDEDKLRALVLQAVVEGHPDAKELARIALATKDLDFARWCA